ncbi:MAG: response regulator transcription factor [Thermotogota bacterium]
MFNELKKHAKANNIQQFEQVILATPEKLFDTPFIKDVYSIFKSIVFKENNISRFQTSTLLLTAWLALLSGDNPNLFLLAKRIQHSESWFKEPVGTYIPDHYSALFEDLQALSGTFGDPEDRLLHSKKALEILGKEDHSFFMANAKLTHGQILVGNERLREGAVFFFQAYELFQENDLAFPASVSLTNAMLNWFRLGEFNRLIQEAKKALMIHSTYQGEKDNFWDIIQLPMGMCYYEQGKPKLAIKNLKHAMQAIDKLKLIHMHGYIEIYMMKAYAITEDEKGLKKMIEYAEKLFQNMHYPMMEWIVLYGKFLLEKTLSKRDIEHLEASFEENQYKHLILIEMLTVLFLNNQTQCFRLEILTDAIAKARYNGDIISLQTLLLLLADYYFQKRDEKAAKAILKEALDIQKVYHLQSCLYLYEFHFWPLVKQLNPSIKVPEKQEVPLEPLTQKEREIIALIASGKSNNDIANKLFIRLGTVKWHTNNIFGKLGVKNRIQAVEQAKKYNYL